MTKVMSQQKNNNNQNLFTKNILHIWVNTTYRSAIPNSANSPGTRLFLKLVYNQMCVRLITSEYSPVPRSMVNRLGYTPVPNTFLLTPQWKTFQRFCEACWNIWFPPTCRLFNLFFFLGGTLACYDIHISFYQS